MRYIINFQIKIKDDGISNQTIRSSYTISEKDSEKHNLLDITKVENWFKDFFKQTPLDHFIDTAKISNTTKIPKNVRIIKTT